MASKKGSLFIISAPSGAGKTTLVRALLSVVPDLLVSVSHTTRERRPHEQDGVDYHFVDEADFRALIDAGQFLEHAEVFGKLYGTSRPWVEEQLLQGRDIILEIDWQGAQQVRGQLPGSVSIFILPPSYRSLRARLQDRGDSETAVDGRMQEAGRELSHYAEYDYLVVNDRLDQAVADTAAVIRAMRHNYARHGAWFDGFVQGLLREDGDIQ